MKIAFDIKYRDKIESGEYKVIYVENSSMEQYPVEILKWDSNSDAGCIIGCLRRNGKDRIYAFDENGEHKVSGEDNRLFIVTPEEEPSEIEERLVKFYNCRCVLPYDKDGVYNRHDLDELLHTTAAELLSLARQQLLQSGELMTQEHHERLMEILNKAHEEELEKAYKNADEGQYRKGREDALKDLPRWKKSDDAINHPQDCLIRHYGAAWVSNQIPPHAKYVSFSDLEKLPGFKED